ncbi:hypothetical protein DVA67_002625 [Solirubrobacter sp. CPCC 204708]|uniref:Membrane protein YczE n=1 Tax=Solirubrobacter deserti TaxID=2282478 RepID=A0ABT4RR74_9ACTN|nr:hypothetical protein [Solirubrobacter deserti]MBE2314856.1 hypothetical protein [Solirubrobacter deserti]MDA0141083.1 hypothetical protein [Solirubrobacter deserti]
MTRRLVQLYAGLLLYGLSMALQVQALLGLGPWDVFHEGVAKHTGLSFGTVVIVTSVLVLLLWIPLRQKPGLGTISNVIVVGLAADLGLALIPEGEGLLVQVLMLAAGVGLNAVAGAAYLGANFGPGARDGLMTGFVRVTGASVGKVRTTIELSVMAAGFALGGTVGLGTIVYALSIGPLLQLMIPTFRAPAPVPT